jgi:hypothetical protein
VDDIVVVVAAFVLLSRVMGTAPDRGQNRMMTTTLVLPGLFVYEKAEDL